MHLTKMGSRRSLRLPVAMQLEHDDILAGELVEDMKELGLFGVTLD